MAVEGVGSVPTLRLVDTLFATGEYADAMSWLEKRAALPDATLEDRLRVAEQLFSNLLYDRALRFFTAVLDLDSTNAQALLRVGQIRSWTNDPRGAIPFLKRRLARPAYPDRLAFPAGID